MMSTGLLFFFPLFWLRDTILDFVCTVFTLVHSFALLFLIWCSLDLHCLVFYTCFICIFGVYLHCSHLLECRNILFWQIQILTKKLQQPENNLDHSLPLMRGEKQVRSFFFRKYIVSVGLYKSCWFLFITIVLDTTLVSRSYMASKFEIPTSTSPTVLSTGKNLASIKIHFIVD